MPWRCVNCGRGYQWRTSLVNHMRVECGKEPTFACPIYRLTTVVLSRSEDGEVTWSPANLIGIATPILPLQRIQTKKAMKDLSKVGSRAPRKSLKSDCDIQKGRDGKYTCSTCGKAYKAATSLSRHKRLECGVQPSEICPICNRRFRHKFVLTSHIAGYLKIEHVWSCKPVKKEPTTEYNDRRLNPVRKRRGRPCNLNLSHVCPCGRKYARRSCLRRHRKECTGEPPLQCILCYNSKCAAASEMSRIPDCVSYAAELSYYMDDGATIQMEDSSLIQRNNARTGRKIRPYFCSGCQRAYTRADSLKRHQLKCDDYLTSLQVNRRDDNQQHYCEQCGKSYRRRDTLQRHQRLVYPKSLFDAMWNMENNPLDNSTNNIAEQKLNHEKYKLLDTSTLNINSANHQSTLSEATSFPAYYQPRMQYDQPYGCINCGKKYKWLDSLRRHQRVECGNKEKRFTCFPCNKKFKYRYELRNHNAALHIFHGDAVIGECYSPGAAIDWYYQYQSMYLRLVAANQMKETLDGTNIDQSSSCQLDDCVNINNHHQQNPQNNSIDLCTNESGQSTSVNNFLNIGSRDLMNNYSCPKCGNGYTRLHSLNRHIRFECGVEPQFECPIKEDISLFYVTVLGIVSDPKQLPNIYACPRCRRSYFHKCNLTRHLRLECGVGPRFQCASCKKKFKHRHHLHDHLRTHLPMSIFHHSKLSND
ncbi:hypothetical protein PV326_001075 [Microctonus aethiopoides]|nr:hypothetical protein PV326_001075 [Microctonus aethiopoides]